MTMLPGDWMAGIGMGAVLGALIFGHLRAVRKERQRDRLPPVAGHPARIARATRDARITEQTRGAQ